MQQQHNYNQQQQHPYYNLQSSSTNPLVNGYKIVQKLGQGSYGIAFKVKDQRSNEVLVMKQIQIEDMNRITDQMQEVKVMSNLTHQHIVKYHGCFYQQQTLSIMQEYCDKGDLTQYQKLQCGLPISEAKIRKFIIEILLALDYIHQMRIIHRDLKPTNIFLKGKELQVKVGDFGVSFTVNPLLQIAKVISGRCINHCNIGTLCYSSPEVVKNKEYDYRTDIWSLGCIIYQLCSNRIAFNSSTEQSLIDKICRLKEPQLPDTFSNELAQIYLQCMTKCVNNRPTSQELLGSEIIQKWARELQIYSPQLLQAFQARLSEESSIIQKSYIKLFSKKLHKLQIQSRNDLNENESQQEPNRQAKEYQIRSATLHQGSKIRHQSSSLKLQTMKSSAILSQESSSTNNTSNPNTDSPVHKNRKYAKSFLSKEFLIQSNQQVVTQKNLAASVVGVKSPKIFSQQETISQEPTFQLIKHKQVQFERILEYTTEFNTLNLRKSQVDNKSTLEAKRSSSSQAHRPSSRTDQQISALSSSVYNPTAKKKHPLLNYCPGREKIAWNQKQIAQPTTLVNNYQVSVKAEKVQEIQNTLLSPQAKERSKSILISKIRPRTAAYMSNNQQ